MTQEAFLEIGNLKQTGTLQLAPFPLNPRALAEVQRRTAGPAFSRLRSKPC